MKHKCYKLKKGKRPTVNHYRFQHLKQISFLHFVEVWNCWDCWKKVEYRIPFIKSINFKRTRYWKSQKHLNK